MEKKDFDQLVGELEFVPIYDTPQKFSSDVANEIRDYIRKSGWDCLDEFEDGIDWFKENHPEITNAEPYSIADVDFLCENKYITEHDVDWYTFSISFYGVWGEIGVFQIDIA